MESGNMINTIRTLLKKTREINHRYEKLSAANGEDFNMFKVLRVEASENRLHSAFIAELLNPKGSHGLKDEFLKLFIQEICKKERTYQTDTAGVHVELHIGFKDNEAITGGRLDICMIDCSQQKIIVENKIYAIDQENQLLRYYNYDNNAEIFYLTLDGKEPDLSSSGHLKAGEHFHLISYKKDIISWLEKCREKAVVYPILRESITQYINLIKYLTGQPINQSMKQEVEALITENIYMLESAFLVANSLDGARNKLLQKLEEEVNLFAKQYDMTVWFNINLNRNHTGIFFRPNHWKVLSIGFQFQKYDQQFQLGLVREEVKSGPIPEEMAQLILKKLPQNNLPKNDWWPYYEYVDSQYDNWRLLEPWKAIMDGTMTKYIEEKVMAIYKLLENEPM